MTFQAPRQSGGSDRAQIADLYRYLYTLTEQLNIAMMNLDGVSGEAVKKLNEALSKQGGEDQVLSNFNAIKSLIIKSADIIEIFQEKLAAELKGEFVAISEYGTFVEETNAALEANSTGISQVYENMQKIETDYEELSYSLIEVNAHINSGLLYYDDNGVPVYGLEIGQRTEIEGVEVFNRFARFTADRLSFFDQNGNEVAYISDRKLYIAHVEILGSMLMGGFKDTVQADGSIVTRWVGV